MPPDVQNGAQRRILSVAELTRSVRQLLEREIGHVWVEGELSNVVLHSSGHIYLVLKDAEAQIRGVFFRQNQRGMGFTPRDGTRVRVFGQVTVYERRGDYQIVIRQMEEAGKGSLQAQFEKLKEKLRAEGLFDAARKRPLPLLPRHIGVVTSPTGAVIRDILHVLGRRFGSLHVMLWPVRVQGEGAAAEIAEAIDGFNKHGVAEVLIVGRGGGSLEDLWAFNEEAVARAIARSAVPVISAVGHETDFTIADFVADVRAPTPSAAAEIVVGPKADFERTLALAAARLARALSGTVGLARARVERAASHHAFRAPGRLLDRHRARLTEARTRMRYEAQRAVREAAQRLDEAGAAPARFVRERATAARAAGARLAAQLRALNPLAVLQRGYSVTWDARGRIVRRAADVRRGERLTTRLAEGAFESEVTDAAAEPPAQRSGRGA